MNKITPNQFVNFTAMNNGTVEIEHLANESGGLSGIRKISKSSYVNTETGEVFEYVPNENRAQAHESARRSYKKLRRLINNNFYSEPNELLLTLTYGVQYMLLKKGWITEKQKAVAGTIYRIQNLFSGVDEPIGDICVKYKFVTQEQLDTVLTEMTNAKVFYDNFRKFMGRFRSMYEDKYGRIEFICVKEPQGSKNHHAWHSHLLVKFTDILKAPFIDNENVLRPLWGFGLTKCQSLKNVNKVAAYVSSFVDLPVDEVDEDYLNGILPDLIVEKEVTDIHGRTEVKKVIKGGRLYLYPSGTKIYSSSKDIAPPETQKMKFKTALRKVRGKKRTYNRSIEIIDESTGICLNKFTAKQYQDKKGLRRYNYG